MKKILFMLCLAVVSTTVWGQKQTLMQRAQSGNAAAQRELALRYLKGEKGYPKNLVQYAKWIKKSAANNDGKAQCCLAYNYREGKNGFPVDSTLYYAYLKKAAENNDGWAQWYLSEEYVNPKGRLGIDFDTALFWAKKVLIIKILKLSIMYFLI